MIKIRVEGVPAEVNNTLVRIRKAFRVLSESRPYQNRNSEYVRVYVEIEK